MYNIYNKKGSFTLVFSSCPTFIDIFALFSFSIYRHVTTSEIISIPIFFPFWMSDVIHHLLNSILISWTMFLLFISLWGARNSVCVCVCVCMSYNDNDERNFDNIIPFQMIYSMLNGNYQAFRSNQSSSVHFISTLVLFQLNAYAAVSVIQC